MRLFYGTILYALIATLAMPSARSADDPLAWPHFRGNREHNGHSAGTGSISQPAVRARAKLGGSTTSFKMRFDDFVHGPKPELLVVESGRLVLKTISDKIIWHSAAMDITEIIGVYDLDRNGREEVITIIPGPDAEIVIFSMKKGEVLWRFNQFGEGAASILAREPVVADLNGDGFLDLVCSARVNAPDVFAFSFAEGFHADSGDNILWRYTRRHYLQNVWYLVGDVDGDQLNEVLFLEGPYITILAGESGVEQHQHSEAFASYSFGPTSLVNVDHDDALELIAIGTSWYNQAITAFDAAEGAEAILWQYQWFPTGGKAVVGNNNSINDVDGDGELEIVVGIYNNADDERSLTGSPPADYDGINEPDRWVTAVYDARTGLLEDYLLDRVFLGSAQLDPDTAPFIVTQATAPGEMNPGTYGRAVFYQFSTDVFEERATINNARVLTQVDRGGERETNNSLLLTEDMNLDGRQELFVGIDNDSDGAPESIMAVSIDSGPVQIVRSVALENRHDYTPLDTWNTRDGETQLVWQLNAGELHQLDLTLQVIASPQLGGYQPQAISGELNQTAGNEVLTSNSKGELVSYRLHKKDLEPEWAHPVDSQSPQCIADIDADGVNEIAVADNTAWQNPALTLLADDGSVIWDHALEGYGNPIRLLSTGYFDDDPILDFVMSSTDSRLPTADDLRLIAVSGDSGDQLWNVPANYNLFIDGTLHIEDWSGDGFDDVTIVDTHEITTFDGTDGTVLGAVPYQQWSRTHFGADIDGDLENELVLVNLETDQGIAVYDFGAPTPLWNIPHQYEKELFLYWPSIFELPSGVGIVKATPSGAIEAFDSDGLSLWGPTWVREGQLLPSDPGGANGIPHVSVADINGDGTEDAIFGTADGYLHAVNTADGTPLWSLPLYGAVGEPILSDVDGDALLEIVVTGMHGGVFVVDQQGLEKPKNIKDSSLSAVSPTNLSPTADPPAEDVDTTEVRTALGASWDPVEGAEGYLMSAVDSAGVLLQPWTDVGNVTSATIETAPLPLNAAYQVVIQAYNEDGDFSAEGTSDGVFVFDTQAPLAALTIEPEVLNPQLSAALVSFELTDPTWLSHYSLTWSNEIGDALTQVASDIYGVSLTNSVAWPDEFIDPASLADGLYTIELVALDDADNSTTVQKLLTIDTVAPMPPTINAVVDTTGQPEFSGTSEPHSSLTINIDGIVFCSAIADEDGNWNCDGDPLPPGEYAASALAEDRATNRSEPSEWVVFQLAEDHPEEEPTPSPVPPAADSGTVDPPTAGDDCSCHAVGTGRNRSTFSIFRLLATLMR